MGSTAARWRRICTTVILCQVPIAQATQTQGEFAQTANRRGPTADWQVTRYSTRQGLPQNWVTALAQTRDGFLWVGTHGGLARFDGTSFRTFDMTSTPELRGNRIRALLEDSEGDLWIATITGGLLRLHEGKFTCFFDTPGAPKWAVHSIAQDDASGAVWFAGEGLTRYRDGAFETVSSGDADPADPTIRNLHRDPSGTLWASTSGGVARLEGDTWVVLDMPDGLDRPQFVGQSPRGLWVKGASWFAYIVEDALVPVEVVGSMPSKVSGSLLDRRGVTWISAARGLFSLRESPLDQPATEVEFIQSRLVRNLTGSYFGALLEDTEGTLWVGLDRLIRLHHQPFMSIPLPTPLRMKWAVMSEVRGESSAWAGSPGLRNYTGEGWELVQSQARWGLVTGLTPARNGGLWVASDTSRLRLMYGDRLIDQRHELGRVRCIYEDMEGVVWLITTEGLGSFSDGVFRTHPLDGIASLPVSGPVVMTSTRAGALWIGCKGQVVVREKTGEVRFFEPHHGLPRGELRGILETSDGSIWISSYGTGLVRWRDEEFSILTTDDGLPNNSLGAILEDDHGNLWINSNQGVFMASLDALNRAADGLAEHIPARMITHTEGDGMEGGKTSDGRFWFRNMNAIDVIDPEAVEPPRAPPQLIIERVIATDQDLPRGSTLIVPPGDGNLEFVFSVVDFSDPGRTRVRYRLEGYEADWAEAPTARTARYTNVPPGTYRFVLCAHAQGGAWGDTIVEQDVVLEPFFWQTTWFHGLTALALIGAALTFHRTRTGAIRSRNERLQGEIDRRLLVEVVRKEQEERLQMALSSAEMGTWRWDPGLNLSTLDASMCRMFGMEVKDITLPTSDLLTHVHPEDLPQAQAEFTEAIAKHSDFVREFRVLLPNGTTRWHRDRGRPHFDAKGELLYVTGASTDITDRKLAEDQRQELEDNLRHRHKMEAIGQLASGVAHEFNNLLVGILCNTDLLLKTTKHSLDEVSKKRLHDIDHCGERAAALTHKLLSFAKRETSRSSSFCVNGVVLDAETMLQGILGERIELILDLGQDLPVVLCDRSHIEQALLNLVLNARHAAGGDGRVTIRTATITINAEAVQRNPEAHEGVHAMLSVTDTGCGMSEQTRARIFEPFFSTKPTGDGTGLGLSTLFADVSGTGGHVTVESREGHGSTFSLFLPQGQPSGAMPALSTNHPAGEQPRCSETILVCDDEQVVLSSVASVLAQEGYEVLEAWGAEDARTVAEAHEGSIHLLLVDVVMPDSNGPKLASELLIGRPSMEVIFMSGYPAEVLRVEGREFEFLKKPPSRKTLLRRVDAVLARARLAASGPSTPPASEAGSVT